jgi:hypothetical protein
MNLSKNPSKNHCRRGRLAAGTWAGGTLREQLRPSAELRDCLTSAYSEETGPCALRWRQQNPRPWLFSQRSSSPRPTAILPLLWRLFLGFRLELHAASFPSRASRVAMRCKVKHIHHHWEVSSPSFLSAKTRRCKITRYGMANYNAKK